MLFDLFRRYDHRKGGKARILKKSALITYTPRKKEIEAEEKRKIVQDKPKGQKSEKRTKNKHQ